MEARRFAIGAGVVCATGWLVKMAVMAGQGGPQEGSAAESLAFLVGLVGYVAVAAAAGALLRPGRRALGAVLGVVVAALALGLVQLALTALPGDAWWQPELAFVVAAVAALAVAVAAGRSRSAEA